MALLRSLNPKLSRLHAMSRAERSLFWQSLLLIPSTCALLRILGFQRTLSLLSRFSRSHASAFSSRSEHANAVSMCRIVSAASRHGLCTATCLRHALVLWFLLRRRGMPAELRIGVRKAEDCLEAHAWVESNGHVLDGTGGLVGAGETTAPFAVFDKVIAHSG